jgi:hypothetical protein
VRIRPLVKELQHILCFDVAPAGDLDLGPMMPKNNTVLPYMMTNISANLKLSSGNEIMDGQTE